MPGQATALYRDDIADDLIPAAALADALRDSSMTAVALHPSIEATTV